MNTATTTPDLDALTPLERHGDHWLKRDDMLEIVGHRGGKVRTCWAIATEAKARGATCLVTAGSRHSPQVPMVAAVARALGMDAICFVPAGDQTPELQQAAADGAALHGVRPGHNIVIVARAREYAADDARAALVPFGMEHQRALDMTGQQVRSLDGWTGGRLVVPVGSGMTLAAILQALHQAWPQPPPYRVVGVVLGADPTRRLDRWAPPWWRSMVDLVPAGVPYHRHVIASVGAVQLDPVYEAKCVAHLQPGDALWVVGRRAAP